MLKSILRTVFIDIIEIHVDILLILKVGLISPLLLLAFSQLLLYICLLLLVII